MDVAFERVNEGKNEWLTPLSMIKILGPFDLDPCFSEPRPWETAKKYYTEKDNGLSKVWDGFVWCNPPYGQSTAHWLNRMASHKRCIGLIFARTETKMFRKYIWEKAKAVLFLYGRISFYHSSGQKANNCAGAPSCLIAWDNEGVERLKRYPNGKLVLINQEEIK